MQFLDIVEAVAKCISNILDDVVILQILAKSSASKKNFFLQEFMYLKQIRARLDSYIRRLRFDACGSYPDLKRKNF